MPVFWLGCDALGFAGFSALGLRVSRFVFFWPLAMMLSFAGDVPNAAVGDHDQRSAFNRLAARHAPMAQAALPLGGSNQIRP